MRGARPRARSATGGARRCDRRSRGFAPSGGRAHDGCVRWTGRAASAGDRPGFGLDSGFRLGSGIGIGLGSGLGFRLGSGIGLGSGPGFRLGSGIGIGIGLDIGFGVGLDLGHGSGAGLRRVRAVAGAAGSRAAGTDSDVASAQMRLGAKDPCRVGCCPGRGRSLCRSAFLVRAPSLRARARSGRRSRARPDVVPRVGRRRSAGALTGTATRDGAERAHRRRRERQGAKARYPATAVRLKGR